MLTRKTLAEAEADKGYLDAEKFDRLTDAEIERLIQEDPDLAPPTETLLPLLAVGDVRRKLGLTQQKFARKLRVPLATLREWESGPGRTDPAMQALLRILEAEPETALRALDQPTSNWLTHTPSAPPTIGAIDPRQIHALAAAGRSRRPAARAG